MKKHSIIATAEASAFAIATALEDANYKSVGEWHSLPAHAIGRPAYMDLPAVAGNMTCKKAGGEVARYKCVSGRRSRMSIIKRRRMALKDATY